MKKLSELFVVTYGNKFDLNKMKLLPRSQGGISFVGRSSQNLGVSATVAQLPDVHPYEAGMISVALGGTKLLSSFVQEHPFYTAQNVAVLKPKEEMGFAEKLFICMCIRHNHSRYSAFGREANRTIRELLVPEPLEFPDWVHDVSMNGLESKYRPLIESAPGVLDIQTWSNFHYGDLFNIERGRGPRQKDLITGEGSTPFITSIDSRNGLSGYTTMSACHPGNTITVNRNGSVGEAYYQPVAFCSTEDVHVFRPKFDLNPYRAMFLTTLIRRERFRYSYGRKWGIERMKKSVIRLPTKPDGAPDWDFMECYIKSLPFSSQIPPLPPQAVEGPLHQEPRDRKKQKDKIMQLSLLNESKVH